MVIYHFDAIMEFCRELANTVFVEFCPSNRSKAFLPKPDYDITFADPATLADDPRAKEKLGG